MKPAAVSEVEVEAARRSGARFTRCPARPARRSGLGHEPAVPLLGAALPDLAAMAGRSWYVVAVELQADYPVREELRARGFTPWLVECRTRVRDAPKREVRLGDPEPAFPGYLLLPLDLARDTWATIEEIDGVDRLLRHAGAERPTPIRGAAIAELRGVIERAGGVVVIEQGAKVSRRWKELLAPKDEKALEPFAKGQALRITAGHYRGFSGLYLMQRAQDRVRLLLDTLYGGQVIDLPEAWVDPA